MGRRWENAYGLLEDLRLSSRAPICQSRQRARAVIQTANQTACSRCCPPQVAKFQEEVGLSLPGGGAMLLG